MPSLHDNVSNVKAELEEMRSLDMIDERVFAAAARYVATHDGARGGPSAVDDCSGTSQACRRISPFSPQRALAPSGSCGGRTSTSMRT